MKLSKWEGEIEVGDMVMIIDSDYWNGYHTFLDSLPSWIEGKKCVVRVVNPSDYPVDYIIEYIDKGGLYYVFEENIRRIWLK